jgi:Xaa-Pro aminopeptidase
MSAAPHGVELVEIELPDFGEPTIEPTIPAATYAERVGAALSRARERGLDALVVYGDREHSANLAFLTGYDPRFEEALLVLPDGRKPALLIGNEGWDYAELSAPGVDRVLYQTFSLLGQPRDRSPALSEILASLGLAKGQRIGAVGWKYFGNGDVGLNERALELPSYIADVLRELVGTVVNATDIFMAPDEGLRAVNDVDQLAAFEFAATYTSQGLRNVLFGVRPGMREHDAARLIGMNGIPLSAHLMLSSGRRAAYGLPSPTHKIIERGDPFTVAYGVWGALNARAGFVVADAGELPDGISDYVDKLVAPYFAAIVEWYETIGIGVEGSVLYDIIHRRLGDAFFGIGLNPGHLIHLDEWVHSPIHRGSRIPLRSGMALQVDVIPATHSQWFTTNIEDGICLADADLRDAFATRYPEAWRRIEKRRTFMTDVLGIRLKPEVLPFSNIPAYLPPFLLAPRKAMRVRRR